MQVPQIESTHNVSGDFPLLPDRVRFADRLQHTLLLAERYSGKVAVLRIDIEPAAPSAATQLLQQCGTIIAGRTQRSDSAAHLEGGRFALLLPQIRNGLEACRVARKLLDAMAPLMAGRQATASLGIALYPDDARSSEALLQCAETAVQRACQKGGGFEYFAATMNDLAQEHLRLDDELRRALATGEFELYYQPKVSCLSGEISGVEALLRWNHPSRGLVLPADFIPHLEDSGLIEQAGEWTLATACSQMKLWLDAGHAVPTMAVNLSARELDSGDLLPAVRRALAGSGLPANRLELELSESVLMRNVEQIIPILAELHQLGVRLTVDDFGIGYSNLAHLKRFPVDAIKVDRSFVQDITADTDDASLTRALINMAHHLKLAVVAEGVESEGQLTLLVANRCDEIQGYFFSRPVPAADMEKMLAEQRAIAPQVLRPDTRQRTILLVDDEENILSSLRRLLRRDGYRILTAGGGGAGLEVLAQNEVDVIISDQRMPGMTGVDFLRRVKTLYPNTIRLVLSGYTELQSITDAINEGAIYKFLTKPWEDEQLRASIEEAFHQKELADENRRLHQELQGANRELAHSNERLRTLLEEKQRQLHRDETTLDVTQEVLQNIPLPLLGVDADGMLVFANSHANRLFGDNCAVLGMAAATYLPGELLALLPPGDGGTRPWQTAGGRFQVSYHPLGHGTAARGGILVFVPVGGLA